MKTRPRTKFARKLKTLRCARCGASINPQRRRCRRCSTEVSNRPKK